MSINFCKANKLTSVYDENGLDERFAPETLHNPVAIKLLVSFFFDWTYMLCTSVFTS